MKNICIISMPINFTSQNKLCVMKIPCSLVINLTYLALHKLIWAVNLNRLQCVSDSLEFSFLSLLIFGWWGSEIPDNCGLPRSGPELSYHAPGMCLCRLLTHAGVKFQHQCPYFHRCLKYSNADINIICLFYNAVIFSSSVFLWKT